MEMLPFVNLGRCATCLSCGVSSLGRFVVIVTMRAFSALQGRGSVPLHVLLGKTAFALQDCLISQ